MKMRVVLDLDISTTMAETMKRSGFELCPDGSAMQIRFHHGPSVPARKVKVQFIDAKQLEQLASGT